jgi:hemoglobin-like flavoprotein
MNRTARGNTRRFFIPHLSATLAFPSYDQSRILTQGNRWQNVAMNKRNVGLLRQSFALIEPQAGIAGLVFYRNLFALDPSLRPLFQSSIEFQARKLMESLSCTIASLDNPESLVPALEAMGRRHFSYGARTEHYDIVIEALLQTFAEVLQSAFSSEVREAWKEALLLVAATMKRGALEARVPNAKQYAPNSQ